MWARTVSSWSRIGIALVLAVCLTGANAAAGERTKTKLTADYPELAPGYKMMQQREWNDAEEWFYEFVDDHPKHAPALRALALVELRRPGGDAVRAKDYIERALTIEPKHPMGLFVAAKAFEALEDPGKAAQMYDKLIELGPGKDDPPRATVVHLARFSRALVAHKRNNLERAKELFEVVLGREPQHGYATYEMGLIAKQEGKTEKAIEWLQKTLDNLNMWAPTESWPYPGGRYGYVRENARYELAKLLLDQGKAQKALEVIDPAAQMAQSRNQYARRTRSDIRHSPLQGEADVRFENAPFYKAEALAALGKDEEAADLFRDFSRFRVGSDDLRGKARDRRRELR
jgi:tetratricopeptide (TPR) repeat protein